MNIFIVDLDMQANVESYVDKHAVKMVTETAQILCTAHHILGVTDDVPYRKTHVGHPACKWAAESLGNYKWLCDLGMHQAAEYTHRYDKTHKSQRVIEWAKNNPIGVDESEMTEFVQTMPDEYRHQDIVEAYRRFYRGAKRHIAKWKRRPIPDWWY